MLAVELMKQIEESIEQCTDDSKGAYTFIQFQSMNGKKKFLEAYQ